MAPIESDHNFGAEAFGFLCYGRTTGLLRPAKMRLVPQGDVNRPMTLARGAGLAQPNFALDDYFPESNPRNLRKPATGGVKSLK
jgi:hypothetical protein